MYIIMGLGNDVINELRRVVRDLDEKESGIQAINKNADERLHKLYEEKESYETKHTNNALDKCIAENDLERVYLIKNN